MSTSMADLNVDAGVPVTLAVSVTIDGHEVAHKEHHGELTGTEAVLGRLAGEAVGEAQQAIAGWQEERAQAEADDLP